MGAVKDAQLLIDEARQYAAGSGSHHVSTLLTELAALAEAAISRQADEGTARAEVARAGYDTYALIREIHEVVTDTNKIVRTPLKDAVAPPIEHGRIPDTPPPPTRWGVRITYVDGTGEDFANVDGVQVYDHQTAAFPFGFVPIADEDGTDCHRAVFYDTEGVPHVFSGDQQTNPNNGW